MICLVCMQYLYLLIKYFNYFNFTLFFSSHLHPSANINEQLCENKFPTKQVSELEKANPTNPTDLT